MSEVIVLELGWLAVVSCIFFLALPFSTVFALARPKPVFSRRDSMEDVWQRMFVDSFILLV